MDYLLDDPELMTPTEDQSRVAEDSGRRLEGLLRDTESNVEMEIVRGGGVREALTIPVAAIRALYDALREIAHGHAVRVQPVLRHEAIEAPYEMTTTEAASYLNVSRTYLTRLLKRGEIPFRMVGAHHRIAFTDLAAYKSRDDEKRRKAAGELTALSQEIGMDL